MTLPIDPKDVQKAVDRMVARLAALSATLTKTDRIITGRRDLAVKFGSQGVPFNGVHRRTPAYTDGKTIAINDAMLPDIRTKNGLVTTLGLNYHELAHNLYTPGDRARLVSQVRINGLWDTFNLLEDARIETLLVAKYRSAAKFLSAPVLEFIIKDEKTWATAHLFTHGRRFLPKEVRRELRNFFQGDGKIRTQCEQIIDEYRGIDLSYEKNFDRAYALIEKLHKIINGPLGDLLSEEEKKAMQQHGACKGIGSPGGGFNNTLMSIREETKEASRRRDEQDAAQEEEEGASKDAAPEGEEDGEDTEDGTEEQPEGDSGDVGDDQEDDGEDIEDEDDEEGGDGWEDDEDDIDEEDDQDGFPGDEPEGDDEGDEGGTEGGVPGGRPGDVGDDGDSSGDDSDDLTGEDAAGGDGAGVGEGSLEDLANALADAVQDLDGDSEIDNEVSRLQAAMDDDSLLDTIMPEIPYRDIAVDAQAAQSASAVIREFQKLQTPFESGWEYGSDYGRLNTQRAMTADWGDTDIFDHWEEGREQDAAVEAFITVDRSSSMGPSYGGHRKSRMDPACKALWVIKRALDDVDGVTTVTTFDSGNTQKLYGRGEKADPNHIRQVEPGGGTDPREAINEGRRVLASSDRPNKLFVIITDGMWMGGYDETMKYLEAIEGTRVFIGIDQECEREYRKGFDVIAKISRSEDIAEVVKQAVTSMLEEATKRR